MRPGAGTARCAILATALTLTAGLEGAAAQDGGVRQVVSFTFDERTPGSPSGVKLSIDYVNPRDANAKPYAVQTLVERLSAGGRFDTSVPEQCRASDAELMSRGASACPAGSRVGAGELDLDTGIEGPGRIVRSKVIELNNKDELILLVEQEGGSRAVSRSPIEGGTLNASAPPLPGGPPDGFTAIKRVRLTLDRIVAGGRGYVTTPPQCPAEGFWENTIQFTYRDGVAQATATRSPCSAPVADETRPRIRAHGVPAGCAASSFIVRIAVDNLPGLRRATARIDGRTVRRATSRRFRIRVRPDNLRPGRHELALIARDSAGRRETRTIPFERCRT